MIETNDYDPTVVPTVVLPWFESSQKQLYKWKALHDIEIARKKKKCEKYLSWTAIPGWKDRRYWTCTEYKILTKVI